MDLAKKLAVGAVALGSLLSTEEDVRGLED